MRRTRTHGTEAAIADLIERISVFDPAAAVCIEKGGHELGLQVSRALDIPLYPLEIRYSLSPALERLPAGLRLLAWPVKELAYKSGHPSLKRPLRIPANLGRIVLLDDSASSGKTLACALRHLRAAGYERSSVCCCVLRCGVNARKTADLWPSTAPADHSSAAGRRST